MYTEKHITQWGQSYFEAAFEFKFLCTYGFPSYFYLIFKLDLFEKSSEILFV